MVTGGNVDWIGGLLPCCKDKEEYPEVESTDATIVASEVYFRMANSDL